MLWDFEVTLSGECIEGSMRGKTEKGVVPVVPALIRLGIRLRAVQDDSTHSIGVTSPRTRKCSKGMVPCGSGWFREPRTRVWFRVVPPLQGGEPPKPRNHHTTLSVNGNHDLGTTSGDIGNHAKASLGWTDGPEVSAAFL